ncbi:phage tail sheath family protein [Hyalangium gracile]|uniref:phage tail sheath family protein n=1 Tax=Hyalangium gracile TaxID=394092 RepID=UPI001CCED9D5|nr:phage tail sheath subtilisin-like domain-containing protein [Hyalangium gracile]
MPEYLAPGVYVEEVSFRSKSIEGVPTSTTGFAGVTRFGPVQYPGGPKTTEPRLITSFTEFEAVYGGLEPLEVGASPATAKEHLPYTAHAARAFFLNGGARLYVSRVFSPRSGSDLGIASTSVTVGGTTAKWKARWPGSYGNVWVDCQVVRSKNIAYVNAELGNIVQVRRAKKGAVVEIIASGTPPVGNAPLDISKLAQVDIDEDGKQLFMRGGAPVTLNATDVVQLVELRVQVKVTPERTSFHDELGADPEQTRYIGKILQLDDPEDENAVIWLDYKPEDAGQDAAAKLMVALQGNTNKRLTGGNDGQMPIPALLAGSPADPDNATIKATGLEALGELDDIAIVALPDSGTYANENDCIAATDYLIRHAEAQRYRIAVVDAPAHSSISKVRAFRGRFDSKYAALYHPWIETLDPTQRPAQGAPPDRLLLPPSGFVAGIYARSDIERGVHKAPANEVVNGLTKFELNINKPRQDVLNPEGINALRFFEGRGNRVWGARTMSSDPEWKYVNVRRLFIYLEHSIDKGTQWAVFEPNNERLWANVRQTIEDFLYVLWKDGALLGNKPEDAFFVRCDRTTMTQNDLDNGRLICLVGVAPTKPAEFVIFRVGQYTANAKA